MTGGAGGVLGPLLRKLLRGRDALHELRGRHSEAIEASGADEVDDGLGEGFAVQDVGYGVGGCGLVGVLCMPSGDVVDGGQDAGEVGHAGPFGQLHVGQGFEDLREEVEEGGKDGRVGVGVDAIEVGFLAAFVVGDEL
ncbi:hypothetical protein [Streptomyces sp. NPDC054837]